MHAHVDVHVCERREAAKNIFVILLQQYCVDLVLLFAPKGKTHKLQYSDRQKMYFLSVEKQLSCCAIVQMFMFWFLPLAEKV